MEMLNKYLLFGCIEEQKNGGKEEGGTGERKDGKMTNGRKDE